MRPEAARAALVAIGDELLAGEHPDLNSPAIARRLAERGLAADTFVVAGDQRPRLERLFRELCSGHELVVSTGGLGPTLDDVTREAAAAAAGVQLVRDEGLAGGLAELWRRRGREMPASNERQAMLPGGSEVMPNRCGTAPGFRLKVGGGWLAALPGPPVEALDMLERELLPWLEGLLGRGEAAPSLRFHLAGIAESSFADRAGEWMARDADPLMGVTSHQGVLAVSLRARGATAEAARGLLLERAAAFRERFAAELFSEDEPRLAFAVGRELLARGLSIATAESCTGGLVAQLLTEVPGISAAFLEGWVTYSNRSKVQRLGVPAGLIERHGAVSSEVAAAMASGAARASGARVAVAVTGVAGPGGGTPEKPVGLVHLAVATDGEVRARELRLPPVDRASIRLFAAHGALDLVRRNLPSA